MNCAAARTLTMDKVTGREVSDLDLALLDVHCLACEGCRDELIYLEIFTAVVGECWWWVIPDKNVCTNPRCRCPCERCLGRASLGTVCAN